MAGLSRSGSYFILPTMLAIVLASLAGAELWRSYHQALKDGEREAENLMHLLAEQMERTVQAIDFTLIGMRDALAVAPDTQANDPRLQATLKGRLAALPFVRALFVIGPDGFLIHDTDYPARRTCRSRIVHTSMCIAPPLTSACTSAIPCEADRSTSGSSA
jgi:two-component system, NtrC family, sensor kinase